MLDNILNKSKPINFVGLLVLFFSCFLFTLFLDFFKGDFSSLKIMESLVFILFFLFMFFLVNFILVKNNLTFDNSYAFFFFITLSIIILPDILNSNTLILGTIYLLILRKIYSLHSIKKVFEKTFDASFWLGVFFLIDPFSLLFFLFLIIGINVHKKVSINAIIIPIVGFAVPLIVYFTYLFWLDKVDVFYDLLTFNINLENHNYLNNKLLFPVLGIFLLTFISLILKSTKVLSINNTFKKSWILLIINILFVIVFLFFHKEKNYGNFIYAIFPIAIILANGIELIQKKLVRNVVLYLFLVGSILIRFFL